ncbi:TonB-dependent receptor [Xanthovirga aplysinae]|uniref:TonB-dependent receptor n=1 Tax=Xanthovirga aplysinae TaxID=2529853 RepID=UPI0012BCF568|nr:carboxypeptidase-like regulatory domain-containing protein [Xanthovirga aplysinae]MTI31437.1 TonB-dependent receptor [Xanthovirga aplysinae]
MKGSVLCMLLISFLGCISVSGQSKKKFKSILTEIEKKYKVQFNFDNAVIKNLEVRTFSDDPKNLDNLLNRLLAGSGVSFKRDGNDVILFKKHSEDILKSIQAIVVNGQSGERLPNALIYLPERDQYATTNQEGYFIIHNITTKEETMVISHIGFQPLSIKIKDISSQEIALIPSPDFLNEVVIFDQKRQIFELADNGRGIGINPEYLKRLGNFGESDVFRSLQFLAGVDGTDEASAGLNVRGGTEDQNLVLFDDFTVYHLDHFFGVLSAFNSDIIKDVRLYKSGFSPKYGGKIASVVEMISKSGNNERVSGQVGLNMLSADAVLELPLSSKLSLLLAGRRSYTDVLQTSLYKNLLTVVDQNKGKPENLSLFPESKFYFYDTNAKLTWRPSPNDVIYLSFFKGNDHLYLEDEFNEPNLIEALSADELDVNRNFFTEKENWGNQGESIRYNRFWNKKHFSEFTLGLSQYFRSFDRQEVFWEGDERNIVVFEDQNNIDEYSLKLNHEFSYTDNKVFDFGLFATSTSITYENFNFGKLNNINLDLKGMQLGGYVASIYKPSEKLFFSPGIRVTYFDVGSRTYWEPRMSAAYQPANNIKFNASFGKYYQFVGQVVADDAFSGQDNFWVLRGDGNTSVLSSTQATMGFQMDLGLFRLQVEGFSKKVNGLARYVDLPLFNYLKEDYGYESNSSLHNEEIVEGVGRTNGVDLTLIRDFPNFNFLGSYTLSKSTNSFNQINEGAEFLANDDQRHQLKLLGTYRWKRLDLGLNWVFGSGKPHDEEYGEAFDPNNMNRLPTYHRLDLNISYGINWGKNNQLEINANFLNLYNRKNVQVTYGLDEFDEPSTDEVYLLGFTPSLGIQYKF